jgi:hypothetical protein
LLEYRHLTNRMVAHARDEEVPTHRLLSAAAAYRRKCFRRPTRRGDIAPVALTAGCATGRVPGLLLDDETLGLFMHDEVVLGGAVACRVNDRRFRVSGIVTGRSLAGEVGAVSTSRWRSAIEVAARTSIVSVGGRPP